MTNEINELSAYLGINTLQARIKICIIEQGGEAEAPKIIKLLSEKDRTNRTSVYLALDQLIEQKLITVCDNLNKSKIYSLVSTDPDQILKIIGKPQVEAKEKFLKILKKANESKRISDIKIPRYYTLVGREMITEKMINLIQESKKYILIRGTITMINFILPFVKNTKKINPDIEIFVQMTWEINPNFDIEEIKNDIKELVGVDHFASPPPLFSDLYSWLSHSYPLSKILDQKEVEVFEEPMIQYAQIFTDKGKILGTRFGSQSDFGIGYFTRDSVATLTLIMFYFHVFETSTNTQINRDLIKNILSIDINSNILPLINKFYLSKNH